ncbi:DUF3311 domain-containing protein [Acidithiobacillus sp. CV18-2]|uniref:DUF3311 domain-containing protein n=1 Tax=Igneacidithiobacillus copahuensis TaxID=2724909 RepID=A0AAE2YRX5_9PROT|nr:DUF3311 domain-containing protein [Igneacidithiobacillus copahuensis]MBU2753842.1 DUF3311 domain-containing protein [Acidithiobacillus sp. CV18-3]MBU2756604.1 DUF3311 domain-containing protein [Acidithiobacillus sp. BN09-2]MBU2777444.1 DUF3311 domain-containing protein [Acidithiobacillus sp. CV18-2]MBU2796194.1 DUF3311 domain-containing protein [Acidithiobacillus sp. VAN18-2]MBU2799861.1 DUF3311 domain-containing protein [Acidithiobacillus sp. VAN18-4]UTV82168.1 DUF3311 domain-containing p
MKRKAAGLGFWGVLYLSIPCIAVLAVPLYNRATPVLFGIPFFYWWQILWVPLSGFFLYLAWRRVERRG